MDYTVNINEVMKALFNDKIDIEISLCHGKGFTCIKDIHFGLYDEHLPGKTVVKLGWITDVKFIISLTVWIQSKNIIRFTSGC